MTTTVTHGAAKIWGSPTGRHVWCECGQNLGPSWEPVQELLAEHVAKLNGLDES